MAAKCLSLLNPNNARLIFYNRLELSTKKSFCDSPSVQFISSVKDVRDLTTKKINDVNMQISL